MPNRELGFWILSASGGGLAGALIAVPAVASNWPWYWVLSAGIIILVAFGVGPWMALGQRWAWWLGSAIGAIVGAIASGLTTVALFGLGLNLCFAGSGCPSQRPFPPTENLVGFSIFLGIVGMGQALTLRGWSRKLTWFITSVIAGAVFGEGLQIASTAFGLNPATPALGPSVAAGVGCGAILGAGALLLRGRGRRLSAALTAPNQRSGISQAP